MVEQQYPPDELVGRDYYEPADRGAERHLAERLAEAARGDPGADKPRTAGADQIGSTRRPLLN